MSAVVIIIIMFCGGERGAMKRRGLLRPGQGHFEESYRECQHEGEYDKRNRVKRGKDEEEKREEERLVREKRKRGKEREGEVKEVKLRGSQRETP